MVVVIVVVMVYGGGDSTVFCVISAVGAFKLKESHFLGSGPEGGDVL